MDCPLMNRLLMDWQIMNWQIMPRSTEVSRHPT